MRKYEITYLVSDEVRETDLNKVTGKVAGFIDALGGKIDKEDIWGRRKLVYPIKKQDFATYVTLNFSLPADKARELEREIRLETTVLRHLMMVKDYGEGKISLTRDEIVGTEEIESLLGEKSFEAVEGETEESRDLMAKRSDGETRDEGLETSVAEKPAEIIEEVVEEPAAEAVESEKLNPSADEAGVESEEEIKKPEEIKEPETAPAEKKAYEKPVKKTKKIATPTDEAERLSKLNDELDDILKDQL